jgi:DNA-binding MarR family transcriptional regulator
MPKSRSLQHEIAQSAPFRNLAEESTLSIVRTATLIRRAVAKAVKGSGLTPAQYNVLRILRGAGASGLATLTIRDRMVDEAPGITRLLDRLESRQFVRRERAKPDRRQVNCYITAKGLDVLRKLDPVIEGDAEWTSSDSLSKGEHRTLVKLLALVRANLEAKLAQDD